MTRDELIEKLKAAGYDEDDLSTMSDLDLQNLVTKIEGTAPANAISKGGQTAPSQYLENQKSEFEKNKAKVAAANTYGNKMLHQNEQLQTAREADKLAKQAAADEAKGVDTSKTGTSAEYANIRDNVINERENEAKAAQTAQETERQNYVDNKSSSEAGSEAGSKAGSEAKSALQDAVDGKYTNDPDRQYLVLNAITTALRNTGLSLNNVAAVMTGGTPSNDYATTEYEKRMSQRAQSATEEGIYKDFANSKLGQSLKMGNQEITANDLTNANRADQRRWAKATITRFFDKEGNFKGDPNSGDWKNTVTLVNQFMGGGGAYTNVPAQILSRLMEALKI